MEALTAVQVGLLTVYDMCKAVDRGMVIGEIRLLEKRGGKSGDWQAAPTDVASTQTRGATGFSAGTACTRAEHPLGPLRRLALEGRRRARRAVGRARRTPRPADCGTRAGARRQKRALSISPDLGQRLAQASIRRASSR